MSPDQIITDDEYQKLVTHVCGDRGYATLADLGELTATSDPTIRTRLLHAAVLTLLVECGLRVSEAIHLTCANVINGPTVNTAIRVPSKIAKKHSGRLIPLGPVARQTLQYYADCHPVSALIKDGGHFLVHGPRQRQLTARTIQRWTHAWAMASCARAIHPHALRHFFGTRLCQVANMRTVQVLLGHSNIRTTQIYTHVDTPQLEIAIAAAETYSHDRGERVGVS